MTYCESSNWESRETSEELPARKDKKRRRDE
jgi:hypothetical protein